MRLQPYLCIGGIEVSNMARTWHYGRTMGLTGATFSVGCPCDAYDEGYDTPETDPAPWYEETRPESADFYGFYASNMRIVPGFGRQGQSTEVIGSSFGITKYPGLLLEVGGLMIARTAEGMAYGEAWLREVLRSVSCDGCSGEEVTYLPACPEDVEYPDAEQYFRSLMGVVLIEKPDFAPVQQLPECFVQSGSFLLQSAMPWRYHQPTRCLDEVPIDNYDEPISCALTTPKWMGDGTFKIDVKAESAIENLVIKGRVSLDGDCPVGLPGTSVPPCFEYTIPEMAHGDRIIIDGTLRRAHYVKAAEKYETSAFGRMTWEGPFDWPEVGPCTTVCVTIEVESGDAVATVDSYLREM